MEAMADNDRVIRSKDRIDEFLARKLEESDLKRIKVEHSSQQPAMNSSGVAEGSSSTSSSGAGSLLPNLDLQEDRMDEDGGSVEPGPDNSDRKRQKIRHVQDQARVLGDARMDNIDVADLDINVEDDEAFDFVDQDEIENREGFDIKELMKARNEEIGFMKELGVWEPSTWEECIEKTGKVPVSTRWVDVDKGREGRAEIRSRLVARDFKVKGDGREFEVFAAMPPLEAKRILFRMAVLDGAVRSDLSHGSVKVMFIDIKKAHLNGKVAEDEYAYVQLPHEAGCGVGRLKRWLYGMRSAASAWEGEYSETLRQMGFVKGRSSSTVFWCPQTDVRLVVWGDDFTVLGRDMNLRLFAKQLSSRYSVKIRAVLGPDAEDDREVRILNRWLRWQNHSIKYEGDEQHVKTVIEGMGLLPNSKGVNQTMYKEDDGEDDTDELASEATHKFRSLAAVVNYMALDRPEPPEVFLAGTCLGQL